MRRWIIRGVLLGLFCLLMVTGLFIYSQYRHYTKPWGTEKDTFVYNIKEGMNARQIGEMLKEKGVIHNIKIFLIVADLRGIGEKLKAGEYEFAGTETPYGILDMLARGYAMRHKLIIPEGFTQVDIAKRCEELEICTKDEFLQLCQSGPFNPAIITQPPEGACAGTEGTLFPETYFFTKKTPAAKVFNRLRDHFTATITDQLKKIEDNKINGLWWQDSALALKEQTWRVTILASIIEKEAKRDADRPLVASVFVNRIKKNMPLQSDATIHYFTNDWSHPLTKDDLEKESLYNTYKHTGLPPAPICNPGLKSLEAAFQPAKSDYLFFMTKSDGSAEFTSTLNEHINLKNQIKKENQANTVNQNATAEIKAGTGN